MANTKRIQFKKLDEFNSAKVQRQDGSLRLRESESKAAEKVVELKAKYESLLTESVLECRDTTAELDALNDEIKKAEETLIRRKEERAIFSAKAPKLVTEQDVVDAWNREFIVEFNEKRMKPALEKLLAVKAAYVEAMLNYFETVDEMEDFKREVYNEIGDRFRYSLTTCEIKTRHDEDKFYITAQTEREVRQRKIPSEVAHMIEAKKGGRK